MLKHESIPFHIFELLTYFEVSNVIFTQRSNLLIYFINYLLASKIYKMDPF